MLATSQPVKLSNGQRLEVLRTSAKVQAHLHAVTHRDLICQLSRSCTRAEIYNQTSSSVRARLIPCSVVLAGGLLLLPGSGIAVAVVAAAVLQGTFTGLVTCIQWQPAPVERNHACFSRRAKHAQGALPASGLCTRTGTPQHVEPLVLYQPRGPFLALNPLRPLRASTSLCSAACRQVGDASSKWLII